MARIGSMQVTALEPTPKDPLQVRVMVAGKAVATLARTRCDELKLRVGLAWSATLAARVAALGEQDKAREAAFRRLAKSALSSRGLTEALVRTGHSEKAARGAVEGLRTAGWLDDAKFAESRAAALIARRAMPRDALAQQLEDEGVDAKLAADAADRAIAGADEKPAAALAREARAAKKTGVSMRTLAGRLARRGFDADAVSDALRAAGYAVDHE